MSEMRPKGYMGASLEVDLTRESFQKVHLNNNLLRLFFGGRGLGTALLTERLLRLKTRYTNPIGEIHALSPDNVLLFTTSPLNGTSVPTCARFHAGFKSPLTGGIGSSSSGGKWGVELKRTGHDVLIITGRSPRPVVLFITEEGVRFDDPPRTDADNIESITDALQERYGNKVKIMTVGAAGRNLSPLSAILNDKGRALGRGGGGAVFSSKNLFAIAVCGSLMPETAHPEMLKPKNISGSVFKALAKLRMGKLTKPPEQFGILPSMGTNGLMGMLAQYGELIHRNFKDNLHDPDDLAAINGEALASHPTVKVKRRSCFNCPIGCTRQTKILGRKHAPVASGEGPEFETIAMLGANLDIYDLELITKASYLCNQYGLDTISLGSTLAALMEIYEIVSTKSFSRRSPEESLLMEETAEFSRENGEPVFGNKKALIPLIQKTAKNTGIGKYIAQGAQRLCERYGHPEAAMVVKGMELPAYDPRATWTQALSYMISSRGGCHLQAGYSAPLAFCAGYGEFPGTKSEGAALVARNAAYHNCSYDVLGVCAFSGFSVTLDEFANMVNDVTGLDYKANDLERISHRTLTLERIFNLLCGFQKRDDWLPERFFSESIMVEGKPISCDKEEFRMMRSEYYEALGWDAKGVPLSDTWNDLGLDEIIDIAAFRKMAGISEKRKK